MILKGADEPLMLMPRETLKTTTWMKTADLSLLEVADGRYAGAYHPHAIYDLAVEAGVYPLNTEKARMVERQARRASFAVAKSMDEELLRQLVDEG